MRSAFEGLYRNCSYEVLNARRTRRPKSRHMCNGLIRHTCIIEDSADIFAFDGSPCRDVYGTLNRGKVDIGAAALHSLQIFRARILPALTPQPWLRPRAWHADSRQRVIVKGTR